jgi:signal transduction histidine kinase
MRIFTRIFLSFWVALVLSILASFLIFSPPETPARGDWDTVLAATIIPTSREAADALESGDTSKAIQIQQSLKARSGVLIELYGSDGDALLPRLIPLDVEKQLRSGRTATPIELGTASLLAGTVDVASSRGKIYGVVAAFPHHWPGPPPRSAFEPLVVLVFISGVVCYILAKFLTTPLVVLSDTARRLAAGDFGARAYSARSAGRDEIAGLVRDFNHMAERIQTLIDAERRLSSDISHELRSPLARLGVALGIARQRAEPELSPALDRIELEAARLNELVGEILRLASMQNAPEQYEFTEVDLAELAQELVDDTSYEANVPVCRLSIGEGAFIVAGDPSLLGRAFENVLRNAVRYTRPGTMVQAGLRSDADTVLFEVRDFGTGVPESELRNLFIPFYRVGSDRGRNTGGHGLGLAITAAAIELHGGTVRAFNADDTGLIVQIRLKSKTIAQTAEA